MPTFYYDGIGFHYVIEGQGRPILFFHGLGGDLSQSQVMLRGLPNITKILMDVRGHGATSPLGPEIKLNFQQFVKDAQALITELGYQRVVVGGISMGAAIALTFSLTYPDLVDGIILIRPAWLNEPSPENLREHMTIGKLLLGHTPNEAINIYSKQAKFLYLKEHAPAVADSLMNMIKSTDRDTAVCLMHIPKSVPFYDLNDLAKISKKVLILGTKSDPLHPLSYCKIINENLPNSDFFVVTSKSQDENEHFQECLTKISLFLNSMD